MEKLELFKNLLLIETAKLYFVPSLAEICEILGKRIVEIELLPIIHRQFLILSPKTTYNVKKETIKYLTKFLKYTQPEVRKVYADYYLSLKDE